MDKASSMDNKKKSYIKIAAIIIVIITAMILSYILYTSLKRKFMSVDDRIRLVENLNARNESLFNRLDNYEGREYKQKLIEYLEFIIKHAPEIRQDMRIIFQEKPRYKFKTKNQILIGGRSRNEFYRNIKSRTFLISDYSDYLNEVKELIRSGDSYTNKPHKSFGKPYRKSKITLNIDNELNKAKKDYAQSKAAYQSYTNRLKEKSDMFKKTRKQFSEWRVNRRKNIESIKSDETSKNIEDDSLFEKPVFNREGMTNREIHQTFKEMLIKMKLEIPSLRKLKQESYEKYKRSKMRYEKLKESSTANK